MMKKNGKIRCLILSVEKSDFVFPNCFSLNDLDLHSTFVVVIEKKHYCALSVSIQMMNQFPAGGKVCCALLTTVTDPRFPVTDPVPNSDFPNYVIDS